MVKKFFFSIILTAIVLGFFQFGQATTENIDFLNLQQENPQLNLGRAYFKINLKEAWEKINLLSGILSPIKIGIIDTGADNFHKEFDGVNFGNTPIGAKKDEGETVFDVLKSHGTNITGIIGANNRSATSSANYIFPHMNGVLSGAKSINYTLENRKASTGAGSTFSTIKKIFELSILQNVQIINISLSFRPFRGIAVDFFFRNTFSALSNTLFTLAAGNDNSSSILVVPANLGTLSNVIVVGATSLIDARVSDSNFGATVNIAAPGEDVWSPTFFREPLDIFDYEFFDGTSASAPMVTGVAGLIKAIKPDLSPATIKQILTESADPIFVPTGSDEAGKLLGSGCVATSTPANQVQRGCRLNALRAVCDLRVLGTTTACAGVVSPPPPPANTPIWPMLQKDAQRTGLSSAVGPASVNIKWQHPVPTLITVLDPLVIAPDSTIYFNTATTLISSDIVALNGATGNESWRTTIPGSISYGGLAVAPDGTIYVCGVDFFPQYSMLTAVSPITRAIKWRFNAGSLRACNAPAIGIDDTIYTSVPPAFNAQISGAVAVNPDGTEKWRYEEQNFATSPPTLSRLNTQTYISFLNRIIAFSNISGLINWSALSPKASNRMSMVDSQNRLFVVGRPSFSGDSGSISAFASTGAPLWTTFIPDIHVLTLSPAGEIITLGGAVVYRLNPQTGDLVFTGVPLQDGAFTANPVGSPIVDADGIIYTAFSTFPGGPQGMLATDGTNIRWVFEAPGEPVGAVMGQDGTIYFSTVSEVYAIGN